MHVERLFEDASLRVDLVDVDEGALEVARRALGRRRHREALPPVQHARVVETHRLPWKRACAECDRSEGEDATPERAGSSYL